VVAIDPSYGMYQVLAEKYDIHYRRVGLNEQFDLNANELLSKVDPMTAMVFICSPNNPTGNHLDLEQIIQVIERANTLVVVDEAYIDFSERPSLVHLLGRYSNLIVVRTLSKAYGLAGLRLGVAVSSSELVNWMNRIKPPYNVNALSQNVALERLQASKDIVGEIELLKEQREELNKALEQCLWVSKVFPSDSNFILVRVDDAKSRYDALVEKGFVVRNRSSQFSCENTLRISVGTVQENKKLISYLTEK
jgi:histidinol-phosphate aminotransferase